MELTIEQLQERTKDKILALFPYKKELQAKQSTPHDYIALYYSSYEDLIIKSNLSSCTSMAVGKLNVVLYDIIYFGRNLLSTKLSNSQFVYDPYFISYLLAQKEGTLQSTSEFSNFNSITLDVDLWINRAEVAIRTKNIPYQLQMYHENNERTIAHNNKIIANIRTYINQSKPTEDLTIEGDYHNSDLQIRYFYGFSSKTAKTLEKVAIRENNYSRDLPKQDFANYEDVISTLEKINERRKANPYLNGYKKDTTIRSNCVQVINTLIKTLHLANPNDDTFKAVKEILTEIKATDKSLFLNVAADGIIKMERLISDKLKTHRAEKITVDTNYVNSVLVQYMHEIYKD